MVSVNNKKMTVSNGFRNYKTSCWNAHWIYAFRREIAIASEPGLFGVGDKCTMRITYANSYMPENRTGDNRDCQANDIPAATKVSLPETATGPSIRMARTYFVLPASFYYSQGRKLLVEDKRNSSGLVGLVFSPRSDLMLSQQCCARRGAKGKVRLSIKIIARGLARRDARVRAILRSVSRLVVVRCQFRGK